tara:strand:- start:8589 stop:8738 length:150 start_codon:yes stop_codon:yes gene_type:complete
MLMLMCSNGVRKIQKSVKDLPQITEGKSTFISKKPRKKIRGIFLSVGFL